MTLRLSLKRHRPSHQEGLLPKIRGEVGASQKAAPFAVWTWGKKQTRPPALALPGEPLRGQAAAVPRLRRTGRLQGPQGEVWGLSLLRHAPSPSPEASPSPCSAVSGGPLPQTLRPFRRVRTRRGLLPTWMRGWFSSSADSSVASQLEMTRCASQDSWPPCWLLESGLTSRPSYYWA